MSKGGVVTYYVEIPVDISYSAVPEEKDTWDTPGYPAHIAVDLVTLPKESDIYALVDKCADEIKAVCMEDMKP